MVLETRNETHQDKIVITEVKLLESLEQVEKSKLPELASNSTEVIERITSLVYSNEEDLKLIKKVKKNFNSSRTKWFNEKTSEFKNINNSLMEIEKQIKAKESEFAKIQAKEAEEIVDERFSIVYKTLTELIEPKEILEIDVIRDEIIKSINSLIFKKSNSGEIKITKTSWDDNENQLKQNKFEELYNSMDKFKGYSRLGDIGKAKFLTNGFDYFKALEFEEQQRRLFLQEEERKKLEEQKRKLEAETMAAERKALEEKIKTQGEENAKQYIQKQEEVEHAPKEGVEIQTTTKLLVEVDNSFLQAFCDMLRKNKIEFSKFEN